MLRQNYISQPQQNAIIPSQNNSTGIQCSVNSNSHHSPHTLYQYNHGAAKNGTGTAEAKEAIGQNRRNILNGYSRQSSNSLATETAMTITKEPRKRGVRLSTTGLFRIDSTCQCHDRDYPPWTGEIHGMSQALLSKSMPLRVFWWMVLVLCTSCGTATTILVIIEYIRGPTATSTTIRLVPSLELPAITVCPKVPDAFNFQAMFNDLRGIIHNIDENTARDLISFWIGGSGLENMDSLPDFNQTYMDDLAKMFDQWRQGIDTKTFFESTHAKFGYKCEDLFNNCELGGKPHNCCDTIFRPRPVMRRGLCYQTLRNINQTEADDIGRLVLEIKAPQSVTSTQYNFIQPQIIIYVNDNFEQVLDFPRFYLYPHEWNRMHFTARYIELLEHPSDCTNKLVGKDANCFVWNWLKANVIDPYNCSVPYLEEIQGISSNMQTCEPRILAADYYNAIQLVHSGSVHSQECIPGCSRWEYSVSLQQSPALQPFEHHEFNLEISFYDLQYEHVKEVYTISVPGFMSQIGGQFGFFLGLSIITMIQIVIYGLSAVITFFLKLPRKALLRICYIFKFRNENAAGNGANQQSALDSPASIHLPPTTISEGGAVNFAMAETSFSGLDALEPIPEATASTPNQNALEGNISSIKSTQTLENKRKMLAKTKKWTSFSIGNGSLNLIEKIEECNEGQTSTKRRLTKQTRNAPEFTIGDGFNQY